MKDAEKMLLEDAIETAIRAEKERIMYRNLSVICVILTLIMCAILIVR